MNQMPLLGRDSEKAVLNALLAGITSGGGALLVTGEPGIGKSALVDYAAWRARAAGFTVLTCVGAEAEARLPFGGLHQLLAPVRGAFDALGTADRDVLCAALGEIAVQEIKPRTPCSETLSVYRVARAALTLLASTADQAPVLVAADDVHWLDEPTCEVLAFIATRLAADPVLLLAGGRDGELQGSPLGAVALRELRLGPLDAAAAEALLYTRTLADPKVRGRLLAWAAGNPLALIELPAAAAELTVLNGLDLSADPNGEQAAEHWGIPPARLPLTRRLEQAFAARLAALPPVSRDLLLIAALNDSADLAEIRAAAGRLAGRPLTGEDMAAVVAAGLAEVTGDGEGAAEEAGVLRFRHPLVRAAVHNAATAAQRRTAHGALAAALSAAPSRGLWHQAAAATAPDEALAAALEQLARDAELRGAAATAFTALQRAIQLSGDQEHRGERLAWAVYLAFDLGRPQLLARLFADADAMDLHPDTRFRLAWLRQNFTVTSPAGVQRLSDTAELAERLRLDGQHHRALLTLQAVSLRCWWAGPDPEVLQRLLATAEALPVSEDEHRLLYVLAMLAPAERGLALLGRLRRIDLGTADLEGLLNLGMACVGLGDLPRAMAALSACAVRCREEGKLGALGLTVFCQAWAAVLAGLPDVAAPAAEEATRLLAELGMVLFVPCAQLATALLAARRGDAASATALAADAERTLLFGGVTPLLSLVRFVRGTAALGEGRYDDAFWELARIFDPGDASYHPHVRSWVLPDFVEAAVHGGHLAEARARHAELVPLAGTSPILAAGLAITAPQLADADTAGLAYQQALGADLADLPLHRARLLLAYGRWLRRTRQAVRSKEALRQARDLFEAAGALPWGERARSELRVIGEESAVRTLTALDLLTPQELHIAQLAAGGLSNREIGQRLYLSPRTVTSHLYRIFPKLGVSSRSGLSAMMVTTARSPGPVG